ncbi:hypothetical protein D3C77_277870 [compost metagenome]
MKRAGNRLEIHSSHRTAFHKQRQQARRLHLLYPQPIPADLAFAVFQRGQMHQFTEAHLPCPVTLHKLQHLADFLHIDFNPFAPKKNERRLGSSQFAKFIRG